jgi:hypothetical protein
VQIPEDNSRWKYVGSDWHLVVRHGRPTFVDERVAELIRVEIPMHSTISLSGLKDLISTGKWFRCDSTGKRIEAKP